MGYLGIGIWVIVAFSIAQFFLDLDAISAGIFQFLIFLSTTALFQTLID